MLCGLGLELARGSDERHERQMNDHGVPASQLLPHLADGFEEGEGLDVADRAADLDYRHVGTLGYLADGGLDFIRDVRNHLHGFAQVVSTPLLGDDGFINSPRRAVVVACHHRAGEAFIVAEVEVGLRAVVGDEYFAVLEGTERPGIDVQVRVEFQKVDPQASSFQQRADRRRGQSLA